MYCKHCGKAVAEDARFCAGCGTPVSAGGVAVVTAEAAALMAPPAAPAKDPVMIAAPKFIAWAELLVLLPRTIFFSLWGGGFLGFAILLVFAALHLRLGPSYQPWYAFPLAAGLLFVLIPTIGFLYRKRTSDRTVYRIYADRMEYYEGFFTCEQKTISFRNVTEVNLSEGVLQRKYGLGTIILATPATGGSSGVMRSGIRLVNITNPDKVYDMLKALVERAR